MTASSLAWGELLGLLHVRHTISRATHVNLALKGSMKAKASPSHT